MKERLDFYRLSSVPQWTGSVADAFVMVVWAVVHLTRLQLVPAPLQSTVLDTVVVAFVHRCFSIGHSNVTLKATG